jgi:hypothetical protein
MFDSTTSIIEFNIETLNVNQVKNKVNSIETLFIIIF